MVKKKKFVNLLEIRYSYMKLIYHHTNLYDFLSIAFFMWETFFFHYYWLEKHWSEKNLEAKKLNYKKYLFFKR